MTAITLTFGSLKGGVGKTSVAVNLAAAWSVKSKRVLLVDADPQGSITTLFASAIDGEWPELSLGDLLEADGDGAGDAVVRTTIPNLDLIPAVYATLEPVERANPLNTMHSIQLTLERLVDDYDLIVIDTPPRLSSLTDAALVASQWAFAVTPPSIIDNSGAGRFADRLGFLNGRKLSSAQLAGWIGNKWSLDSAEARIVDEFARESQWPLLSPLLPSTVRINKSFVEAQAPAVVAYPNAPYSLAVAELADNIWKRVAK